MLRLLLVLVALALVPSCGTPTRPPYTISIVDSSGRHPFDDGPSGIDSGSVTILVRQGDTVLPPASGMITGGVLAPIELPIPSYGVVTRIQVLVEDDESDTEEPELIGATPPFVPLGYGFVRIVIGPPSTCEQLSAPTLSSDRVGPNLVAVDSNLISIGGDETDGASGHVQQISPLQLTFAEAPLEFPALARPLSAGGALRLGDTTQLVVLSVLRGAVLFELDPNFTGNRDVDLTLDNEVHPGAGPSSALVDLGTDGIAIVGGAQTTASDEITWVDVLGATTTSRLTTARERPAAIRLAGHILVAGGQADGRPLFELVEIADHTAEAVSLSETSERFAPVLTRDSGGTRAWLGFGEDGDGNLLDTTWAITGCPSACVLTAAAPLERPRRGVHAVERSTETVIVGGADDAGPSGLVDRVRFDMSGMPVVEALGPLVAARDRPGAAQVGGGIVIVGGGQGIEHALSTMEICFPEALDPI